MTAKVSFTVYFKRVDKYLIQNSLESLSKYTRLFSDFVLFFGLFDCFFLSFFFFSFLILRESW